MLLISRELVVFVPASCFFVSADAAKDGVDAPALAGYMHGLFWTFQYSPEWMILPIAVLEFSALALPIILFVLLLDSVPAVVLQTDLITTAFVLTEDAARLPLLVFAHNGISCCSLRPNETRGLCQVFPTGEEWRSPTFSVPRMLRPITCRVGSLSLVVWAVSHVSHFV